MLRLFPVLLGFSLLVGSAAGQSASASASPPEIRLASPFHVLRDGGPRGSSELSFDVLATYDALDEAQRTSATLHIAGFALPGGEALELVLRPMRVMEDGGTAVVHQADGTLEPLAPSVRIFSGSVPGRASQVFLALSPAQLNGYLELDGTLYILSSGGDRGDGRATLAHAASLGATPFSGLAAEWCATPRAAEPIQGDGIERLSVPEVRYADVFLELDDRYRALFASDQAALDYCLTLVGATSQIYRRDLGIVLQIPSGYVNLWQTTPPWGVITTFGDVARVAAWWISQANPNRDLRRAAVHVLTNPVFGGVASSIASLCSIGNGYEISSVFGHFPFPIQHTDPDNWDLLVVSHEFGHTFGAQHTQDIGVQCDDGTGPDRGTIMGYCHLRFGVGAVGMRFHRASQDEILFAIRGRGCIRVVPIAPGDYDADGDRDLQDLAAFDAYRVQGFVSQGSVEVFDMNSDGTVDSWDRAILVAAISGAPPATLADRNGSGLNPVCYFSTSPPILGTSWPALVTVLGRRPTFILGFDAPLAGTFTPYGELLAAPPAFGGTRLFTLAQLSDGFFAEYETPLPEDPALAGLQIYTQALVISASGPELCNAIDLTVGYY